MFLIIDKVMYINCKWAFYLRFAIRWFLELDSEVGMQMVQNNVKFLVENKIQWNSEK